MSVGEQSNQGHFGLSIEVFYTVVAVILFLITVGEVALLYPPLNMINGYVKVAVLVVLSVAKFVAVVAFFMHLYFDSPLCTFLFSMGMVMATGTVVALIHLFPPPKYLVKPTKKEQWVMRPAPLAVYSQQFTVDSRDSNAHSARQSSNYRLLTVN